MPRGRVLLEGGCWRVDLLEWPGFCTDALRVVPGLVSGSMWWEAQ